MWSEGPQESRGGVQGVSSRGAAERGFVGQAGRHAGRWCPQAHPSHLSSPLEADAVPLLLQKSRGSTQNALCGATSLTPEDEHNCPAAGQALGAGLGGGIGMAGKDKQRCKAAYSRAAAGGTGGEGSPAWPHSARLWWQQARAEVTSFSPGPGGGRGRGAGVPRSLFICLVGLRWGIWELSRPVHLCGQSCYFSLPCRSQQRTAPALPLRRPGCPGESQGCSARVAWVTPGPFLPTAN